MMQKTIAGLFSIVMVMAFWGMSTAGETPADTTGTKYVGAKKCKMCHIKQYKSWKKTKMAMSFESLKKGAKVKAKKKAGLDPDKDYTADPDCLRCHTTGYGNPTGFTTMAKTPKLAGVQCEACHGPGKKYIKVKKKNKKYKLSELKAVGMIVPSEDKKGCMRCHGGESPFTEKLDPKYRFDFKERIEKTHKHFPLKYKH